MEVIILPWISRHNKGSFVSYGNAAFALDPPSVVAQTTGIDPLQQSRHAQLANGDVFKAPSHLADA